MSSSSQSSPKSPSPSQPRYRDFTKIQSFWLKQNTPRSLSSDGPDVEDVEENEDLLILESQLSDRIYELNQSLKSINSNHGSVLQKENEKFFIQKKQLKYNHLSNIKDLKLIKLDNLKLLKEIGYKYNLLEIQLKDLKNLEEDLYNKINNYDGDLSIISEKNSKQLLISELKEEISDITEKINENNLKIDNLNEIIKSGNDDYKETLDKYLKEVKMRRNLEQIILDYKGKLCCYINLNNNNNNNLEEEMQLETEKEMENEIIIDEKQIKFTSLNQEFNLDGIFTNIPDYSLTISIALKDIIVKGKDISIINPNIVSSSTNNNFSSSIFKNFEIILNSTVDTCELKRQKYGNDDNNFVYGISFQIISFNSENHNDDDIIDIIKLISNNNLETTLTTTVGDRNDEVTCLNNLFSISTTKVKYNKDDYDNFKSQLESYFLQNYNNKNNVLFKFYISSFDKLKNLKKSNSINFINFCSGSDYISTNVISNILNPSLTLPSLSLPPPPPQQQQQEEDISSDSNNDETSMSATVKSSTPKPRLIQVCFVNDKIFLLHLY